VATRRPHSPDLRAKCTIYHLLNLSHGKAGLLQKWANSSEPPKALLPIPRTKPPWIFSQRSKLPKGIGRSCLQSWYVFLLCNPAINLLMDCMYRRKSTRTTGHSSSNSVAMTKTQSIWINLTKPLPPGSEEDSSATGTAEHVTDHKEELVCVLWISPRGVGQFPKMWGDKAYIGRRFNHHCEWREGADHQVGTKMRFRHSKELLGIGEERRWSRKIATALDDSCYSGLKKASKVDKWYMICRLHNLFTRQSWAIARNSYSLTQPWLFSTVGRGKSSREVESHVDHPRMIFPPLCTGQLAIELSGYAEGLSAIKTFLLNLQRLTFDVWSLLIQNTTNPKQL